MEIPKHITLIDCEECTNGKPHYEAGLYENQKSICPDCEGERSWESVEPFFNGRGGGLEPSFNEHECDTCSGSGEGKDCGECFNTNKVPLDDSHIDEWEKIVKVNYHGS